MDRPTLTTEEARKMLSKENIANILRFYRSQEQFIRSGQIELNGDLLKPTKFLGSGGTKEVYEVKYQEKPYALAICGYLDFPSVISQKWNGVLREPANTNKMRELGFNANKESTLVPIKLYGYDFPALLMTQYADHEFQIYDSKNNHDLLHISNITNLQDALLQLDGVAKDITSLIKKGVILERDNFNICNKGGQLRLYFNDLGSAQFYRLCKDEIPEIIESYTRFSRSAYINAHSHEAIVNNPFLSELVKDYNGEPLKSEFIREVTGRLIAN